MPLTKAEQARLELLREAERDGAVVQYKLYGDTKWRTARIALRLKEPVDNTMFWAEHPSGNPELPMTGGSFLNIRKVKRLA